MSNMSNMSKTREMLERSLSPIRGDDIPTGATFVDDDLIGKWKAGRIYTFGYEGDLEETVDTIKEETELVVGENIFICSRSNEWMWFTCFNKVDAVAIIEALNIMDFNGDKLQKPVAKWQFEARDADIISLFKHGAFGDPARLSCRISNHGIFKGVPYKYQHELHMIALPAAVAAVADIYGYPNPGFDLSELLSSDYATTDDNQAKFVGAEGHDYRESVLWQRRAALWKALGEENPSVYNQTPVDEDGNKVPQLAGTKGYKLNTASEMLDTCLKIFFSTWAQPMWVRLALVTDPRVDAISNSGNHLSVPAVVELYEDEAEAREAAGSDDNNDDNNDVIAVTTAADNGSPAVPVVYTGFVDDWKDAVRALKSKPLPIALNNLDEAEFGATKEDVKAWWDMV